jgi:hypothetical protein
MRVAIYARVSTTNNGPRAPQNKAIRRIFNNDQLIERFGRWLLAYGKAEHRRINYIAAVRQFAKFLVDKPLTAATKDVQRGPAALQRRRQRVSRPRVTR